MRNYLIMFAFVVGGMNAHSWLVCTDYLEKNAREYSSLKCRGYPRAANRFLPAEVAFGEESGEPLKLRIGTSKFQRLRITGLDTCSVWQGSLRSGVLKFILRSPLLLFWGDEGLRGLPLWPSSRKWIDCIGWTLRNQITMNRWQNVCFIKTPNRSIIYVALGFIKVPRIMSDFFLGNAIRNLQRWSK